jgi:hypothetical protein
MKNCFAIFFALLISSTSIAQSQKIVGTIKASKNNAITITPNSVDSTLQSQTITSGAFETEKSLIDKYPPTKTSTPTNNSLVGKKIEKGNIAAEKAKPIIVEPTTSPETVFQIVDTTKNTYSYNIPSSADSLQNTALTILNNTVVSNNVSTQKPTNSNTSPISNSVVNTISSTPSTTVSSTIQQEKKSLSKNEKATKSNTTSTILSNIYNNYLPSNTADANNKQTKNSNSAEAFFITVNTKGYFSTFSNNGNNCSLSSFGRITNFSTANGINAEYNAKGELEKIGSLKIDYTFEGRVAAINGIGIKYNSNGNILQIGDAKILYNNGKIESIGGSKLYYDASGNITNIEATTSNVIFNK